MSDTLTLPLVFDAADKLRHVEHTAVVRVEVENAGAPDIFADVHDLWLTSPQWRPLRETVELLLATEDWVEAVVAINLVLEPLIGHFLRNEYLRPAAERNGDRFIPLIAQAWAADAERARAWTDALVHHLVTDSVHGTSNRQLVRRWILTWRQRAEDSAKTLTDLPANAPDAPPADESRWRDVLDRYDATAADKWGLVTTSGASL
ncbi:hypothetical protein PSU4_58530 [Pseudonocardia sulfidoxydans NBRC 16205]|uniref:propane 2-monooxygenase n=1 Tax=Pseudonocardia sulfidoxydans NBRC 16205 TaxID=1223511 RepID=A0A511DQ39_9PSEU|nr:hypothetical protein PSU4_58530 [Pseudonocardia sulfidoxydans NBRC 16205]